MAALPENDLVRLVKLLRMLGTDFDGERAAFGWKIHELVTSHKADWDDLLRPIGRVVHVRTPSAPRTWRVVVEEILEHHYGALYPTEREFLPSLLANGRVPTERQAAWLAKIVRRCGIPAWEGEPR